MKPRSEFASLFAAHFVPQRSPDYPRVNTYALAVLLAGAAKPFTKKPGAKA